jgi:hypothetical protein
VSSYDGLEGAAFGGDRDGAWLDGDEEVLRVVRAEAAPKARSALAL